MRKQAFVAIALLLLLSCEYSGTKKHVNDDFLIGQWRIYIIGNVMCNACPDIVFSKDHSGFIKRFDPKLLYFNWKVEDGKLIIKHTGNKDEDNVIADGAYKWTLAKKTLYQELSLTDTLRKIEFILRK